MSKQETEPQSYSVDEMMERLRDGEREKEQKASSELVTRPDGTQVVRVRKRKRRSQQEESKSKSGSRSAKSGRKPLAIVLVLAVLVLVGVAIGLVVLLARYNSQGFRTSLEGAIGQAAGAATVGVERMSVTPLGARAKSVTMNWGAERTLQSLRMDDLEADLSVGSFLIGQWSGEEVLAKSGEMILGAARTEGAAGGAAGESIEMGFTQYRCEFLNIYFGASGSGNRLKNVELTLRTEEETGTQLLLRGGEGLLSGWKPLAIDRGMAELTGDGMRLTSLRLMPKGGETGELTMTSKGLLRAGEDVELNLNLQNFPLSSVIGEGLGEIVDGTIESETGSLSFKSGSPGEWDLRIEFTGKSAQMRGLPFLTIMQARLGDSEFARPRFDQMKGVFLRNGSGMRLQDLELVTRSQMIVRGYLEVDQEGALGGRLEVGVEQSRMINGAGHKRSSAFSDPREGYCWVTINLSGTLERPTDDFHKTLQVPLKTPAPRNPNEVLDQRFDELTR